MRKLALAAVLTFLATPAFAGAVRVPEMDAGAGVAALALLIGAVAIVREKFRK